MALELPESMEELVYWTSRNTEESKIKAWVYREDCPECGKALMGKPKEKGKVKIRAPFYICPECEYKVTKTEYEETLTVNILYTCPNCKHSGEAQTPFKRKSFKGVKAVVFECGSCNEKIPITKKMKRIKQK